MKIRLIIVFLISSLSLAFAQTDTTSDEGEFSILRSKTGVKIIFNSPGSNLVFDLKCSKFKQIESENMLFMADDMLIQLTPVPLKILFKKDSPRLNDSVALIYHMNYEMKNIRSSVPGSYEIKPEFLTSDLGRLIGFFSFDMPKVPNDTIADRVVSQMYATTKAGNKIFMLSCAVAKINDPKKVKSLFIESFGNLVEFPIMIDIEKIREEMMKEDENSKIPDQG